MITQLHKAIYAFWVAQGLDALFKAKWKSSVVQADFIVLHDQEAGSSQPMPYCTYSQDPGSTPSRMTGSSASLSSSHYAIRDIPWRFSVHARRTSTQSAKEICAELIGEIMKIFGDHPTTAPSSKPTLEDGSVLLVQYQNDYGVRTGEDEYSWVLRYLFRLDVPVIVG